MSWIQICNQIMATQKLYSIHEVPDYLQSNEFIHQGYRKDLTTLECVKSIFIICNETVNIWTHLAGAVSFIFLALSINSFVAGFSKSGVEDHVIVTLTCLCFWFCLFSSSMYHIFNSHSRERSTYCFRLDLAGISISLCGIYFPGFFYGFHCFHFWRRFYTASTFVLILVNLSLQVLPSRVYSSKRDNKRIGLFVVMVLFGIIPTCHWIYLHGGLYHPLIQEFLPMIVKMYMITGMAFFFYVTKIPERFLPGYCDYFGSSHQWWHVFILSAFFWWYACAKDLLKYTFSENNQCLGI